MALLQAPPDTHTHSQLSFCRRSPAAGRIEIWSAPFYHAGNMRGIFSHLNSEGEAVWKNRKKASVLGRCKDRDHFTSSALTYVNPLDAWRIVWLIRWSLATDVSGLCWQWMFFPFHFFFKHLFSLCRAMQRDDTLKNILHSFCSFTCWEIQIQALAW